MGRESKADLPESGSVRLTSHYREGCNADQLIWEGRARQTCENQAV